MEEQQYHSFPPFALHGEERKLYRDQQPISLRPQSFTVLYYFVTNPKRTLSKGELLRACRPATQVSSAALKVCIREIRQALEDNAAEPRFIETLPRRGYRFVASVTLAVASVPGSKFQVPRSDTQHSVLVGRDAELAQLHGSLEKARNGERRLVFITGEPGIGKTALIEAFRQKLEAGDWKLMAGGEGTSLQLPASPVSFAHGQCVEHYGNSEAYLPVLAALDRLCRLGEGASLLTALRHFAPTWLLQLTLPLTPEERAAPAAARTKHDAKPMLREIDTFLTTVTVEQPLILVIEDMHWSITLQ